MNLDEKLSQFIKDAKDWERMATSVRGVFLLKLPSYKARSASVAIEINPADASGSATKKRGVVIRSASELNEINSILTNPKLAELARNIDTVNPKRSGSASTGSSDIFEI
jgi:hypothetical protein